METERKALLDEALDNMLSSLQDEEQMTEKQRRILESAIHLFAEKGFHASSTSEIAQRAGVAEGTIFKHFKTKTNLLYALIAPMFFRFASPLILKDVKQIMGSDLPAKQVLEQLYQNRYSLLEENWPRVRIIFQEALFDQKLREIISENLAKEARLLAEHFIAERIEQGEFRPLPIKAITHAIFSMMFGYVVVSKLFPEDFGGDQVKQDLEQAVDILLHGIAAK